MLPFKYVLFLVTTTWFSVINAERVYLLDTLNATSELNWRVHSNQESGDEWQEETYRSESLNLNHQAFATCMIEHGKLENWLLLPRIDRGEAWRLHFEIKFTMKQCQDIPSARTTCKETLKLYALPIKRDETLSQTNWHEDERWEFVDTISPKNDEKSQVFVQTSSYAPNAPTAHFAIKDEGACTSILYIKVYYEVCAATTAFLTTFPRTVAGADLHAVQKVTGDCAQNATVASANFKRPISLCKSDGSWQLLTGECECAAGYIESRSTNTCAPCGVGSYKQKAGNGECRRCPERSFATALSSTFCECDTSFYRPFGTSIDQPCIPVETSTNHTIQVAVPPVQTTENESGFPIKISQDAGLIIGVILVIALICAFMLVVIVHQRTLSKGKHQSDLDVLDNYKPGSMTPDYGQLGKSNFSAFQSDYTRKLNVPLIPAYGTCRQLSVATERFRSYVDPTTYEDPQEALAEFANEITPESVEVTRTIGAGEFGSVCCGRLKVENMYGGIVQQIVAVKTLLPGSSLKARSDFLMEASIMGQFDHPNVIHLVGVVTKSEPAMILTEYMLNGSLDQFLRANDNGRLCMLQLVQMMCDVAQGMSYLTGKGYVHRDLAARNVLVDDRLTCKIADFGLSRGVSSSGDQEYTTQGGKIPIRWTSPEAISHRKYTAASDVWSFGVVCWEILAFGERPYWDWTNHKVIQEIQNGFRLPCPMDAPACLHELMLRCWEAERHMRPTFEDLVHQLNVITYHFKSTGVNARLQTNQNYPTDLSIPTLADFLQFSNLAHCAPALNQRGIRTIPQLKSLEYNELIQAGISDYNAQQIICCLSRSEIDSPVYDGIANPFSCSQHAIEQTEQEQQSSSLSAGRSIQRTNKTNCSPLLSTSSVLTSQTAVTNASSNASTSLPKNRLTSNFTTTQSGSLDVTNQGFFV
ncbi:Ephrin type-A receptor 4 isoform X4 [Aphelenchoides besseyi]|nr:Ephrin type-A receptor 4 isoform X4 [Aphelenchoides besseyi]